MGKAVNEREVRAEEDSREDSWLRELVYNELVETRSREIIGIESYEDASALKDTATVRHVFGVSHPKRTSVVVVVEHEAPIVNCLSVVHPQVINEIVLSTVIQNDEFCVGIVREVFRKGLFEVLDSIFTSGTENNTALKLTETKVLLTLSFSYTSHFFFLPLNVH